jgi:hypothetical protein
MFQKFKVLKLFLVMVVLFWTSAFVYNATLPEKNYQKFHQEAQQFIEKNQYHADFYILVDLSIHSGKNRFFVYDFKQQKNTLEALTTHGSCDQFESNPTKYQKVKFSNENNSHCSSQGKYRIGKRDYSSWGINIKYWLHGLEKSNDQAVKRVVVLHSWDAVSDNEIYPQYSPLSWGCPAISNEKMKEIDPILKPIKKPVLLWIIGD